MIKVKHSPLMGQTDIKCLPIWCIETCTSLIAAKSANLNQIMKHQTKAKWSELYSSKSINVIKHKKYRETIPG